MEHAVIRRSLSEDELDIPEGEVLRYLGYKVRDISDEDLEMVRSFIPVVREVLSPKACYTRCGIELREDGQILMPYGWVHSLDLSRNLAGCREIFICAATLGIEFDRLLRRTSLRSMADAAVIQSIGAAAAEEFIGRLNDELREEAASEGLSLKPRYSPGFGDYGLENQRGIFSVLEPARYIGLSLKDNCIMSPEKSVTAIIGIYGNTR